MNKSQAVLNLRAQLSTLQLSVDYFSGESQKQVDSIIADNKKSGKKPSKEQCVELLRNVFAPKTQYLQELREEVLSNVVV